MSQDMAEDAIETIAVGTADYDRFTYASQSVIQFRGKTLDEWTQLSKMPEFISTPTLEELEQANIEFIKVSELIINNYGRAKSAYQYAKAHYEATIRKEKSRIISDTARYNALPTTTKARRIPGAEVLEDRAITNQEQLFVAYSISKIFRDFWETKFELLKQVNFRLTGMNSLKNTESRLGM